MSIVIKRSGDKKKGKPNAWVLPLKFMFTLTFLLPAAAVSFCAWSDIFFRPADWDEGARAAYALYFAIVSLLSWVVASEEGER